MKRLTTTRAMSSSSGASKTPHKAGPSIYDIPPARTPEDKKAVVEASCTARLDMNNLETMQKTLLQKMPAHNGMTTRSMSRAAAAAAAAAAAITSPSQLRAEVGEEDCSVSTVPSTVSAPTPEKTLREYQSRIASTCEENNTLVVLPTGAGKTFIAAEVIKRLPPCALFIVPKRILVDQQAKALRSWSGHSRKVFELKGGAELPHNKSFDVLVATPEAFRVAQESDARLDWSAFKVVVFDEVHHVAKEHPYRRLALTLGQWSGSPPSSRAPRVIGLTASYTYEMGDARAQAALEKMCNELLITNTETATREELEASGYQAPRVAAKVSSPPATITPVGVLPEADRVHEQTAAFLRREQKGENTKFASELMACVRSMENAIKDTEYPQFASPLALDGDVKVGVWGAYAHNLARQNESVHLGRRATSSGTGRRRNQQQPRPPLHRPQLSELEHWYEAVKTLVVSWEEREDHAAAILDMFECTGSLSSRRSTGRQQQQMGMWPGCVVQKIRAFWEQVPATFPRFEQLKDVLLRQYEHHDGDGTTSGGGGGRSAVSNGGGKAFRGIVFVRERVTTHVLAHVIRNDPRLASRFSTACLHAACSPATASLSLSDQKVDASIDNFRSGRANLLLATAAAEEGMDVPMANCVIRYDAMEHPVSMVQGRGRAREAGSTFVVLRERSDRTTADLEAVERRREQQLKNFTAQPLGSTAEAVIERDPIFFSDDTTTTSTSDAGNADTCVKSEESNTEVVVPLSGIRAVAIERSAGSTGAVAASDDVGLTGTAPAEAEDAAISGAGETGTFVEPVGPPLASGQNVVQPRSATANEFIERSTESMGTPAASDDVPLAVWQALERGARGILLDQQEKHGVEMNLSSNGTPTPPQGVLRALEQFAEVTHVDLKEIFEQDPVSRKWSCTLLYESALRELHARGKAVSGKKIARKLAAARLVAGLIRCTVPAEPDDVSCSRSSTTDSWVKSDEDVARLVEPLSAGAAHDTPGPPSATMADFVEQSARSIATSAAHDGRADTWVEPDESIAQVVEPFSAGAAHDTPGPPSATMADFVEQSSARSIAAASAIEDVRLSTWQALERGARGILLDQQKRHGLGVGMTSNGTPMPPKGVLSAAMLFADKTNVVLRETFDQEPSSGLWVCTLSYESMLRELHARGEAVGGKKTARKLAAARLVADLLDEVPS